MTDQAARFDLKLIIARYPTAASAIRRLALADTNFRSICEDFLVALAALQRLRSLPDGENRPETHDYLAAVHGLDKEIRLALEEDGALPGSEH
jgi:hypothetical protein